MTIGDTDIVLTAYAKLTDRPGFIDTPLWVIVREKSGLIRQEIISSVEQSAGMQMLYPISNSLNSQMCKLVETFRYKERRRAYD